MTTNSKIKINLDSLKSRREWKRHKVKDGHNIFRILPPFGENSNGYPYRKWQIIWGLVDPESGRARPFASSMTSEKRCPVTEFVAELKERAETIESKMKAAGSSEDDVKASLKDLRELINNLTPKTVYIYNAADKAGEVGLLELKSTAHKAMKTQMNQYIQDYNQDPTSLNSADDDSGVWFDITRQGLGRDTEYSVTKCQTRVKNGASLSFVDDRAALPPAVVENYDNLAYDLSSVYQIKTYEELQEILDFNLPGIMQTIPAANLSADDFLKLNAQGATTAAAKPAVAAGAKPASKVTTKIDDGDDDDGDTQGSASRPATNGKAQGGTQGRSASASVPTASKAVNSQATMLDDDFMAEADAILNG